MNNTESDQTNPRSTQFNTQIDELERKKMYLQAVTDLLRDPAQLGAQAKLADKNIDSDAYLTKLNVYRKKLAKEVAKSRIKRGGYDLLKHHSDWAIGLPELRLGPTAGNLDIIINSDDANTSHMMGYVNPADMLCFKPENSSSINHESTSDFVCGNGIGMLQLRMTLNDDDSFWRKDNPDWFTTAHSFRWELPETPWDATVDVGIFSESIIAFQDCANKYGRIMVNVLFGHSDPRGEIPKDAFLITDHYWQNEYGYTDLILDEQKNGWYELDPARRFLRFHLQKGTKGKVELAFMFRLLAQDGQVSAVCNSILHEMLLDGSGGSSCSDPQSCIRSTRLAYFMKKTDTN